MKKPKSTGSPFDALKGLKAKPAKDEEEATKKATAAGKAPKPAPAAPKARPAGSPYLEPDTEDEALTFHRMMSGVKPLEAGALRIPKSQEGTGMSGAGARAKQRNAEGLSAAEREAEEVHAHLRALVEGTTRFEVTDDGRHVEGRRIDVTPDVLRKLRRGVMPIDARVDLHGLRAEGARQTLEDFLRDKRARGERTVLVVHGKGEHSPGGTGVLRGEISAWLSQSRASEHVAAFATATPEDGGEGAVYVLLRK